MRSKTSFRIFFNLIIISFLLIMVQGCDKVSNPTEPEFHERGEIDEINNLINMNVTDIHDLLSTINLDIPFELTYSVQTYSVNYYTIDGSGNEVLASGAIYIPQGVNDLPLVSIQHGTETKRDHVASVSPFNSVEGYVGLIMASMGYVVLIPDYIGLGVSNVMHPYLHAESLIPSVIDILRAGKTYCSDNQVTLDGRTFLTGYSEGGYTSLLTQKKIEENYLSEFNLTAVAPSSGPYDFQGMMEMIFQSDSYSNPAYIAFFLTAYNEIYNWNRLSEILNEPYASITPGLFDGSKTWGEIISQMPSSFSELVNSTFISNVNNGNEEEFLNSLLENTQLNWVPQTPIHFFHGEADEIVPIQNAITARDIFTANGATGIQLTIIPDGTHLSSGPEAVFGTIEWFEGF